MRGCFFTCTERACKTCNTADNRGFCFAKKLWGLSEVAYGNERRERVVVEKGLTIRKLKKDT